MSKRSEMLASVIRDLIAPALRACPPECGVVTITEVKVSPDFSYATVYLSALNNVQAALAHFEELKHELQQRLGALHRKKVPKLRFRIDARAECGQRIDILLEEAEGGGA